MGETSTRATDRIRILHVDDEPDFADLAAKFLERQDSQFSVETITSASGGLDRLADTTFDCIISDYDMPGQNGIEFLETVREEYPDLPFILYTGKGSEVVASDAISAGVTDYLQKDSGTDQYIVLANRVRNAVEGYRTQRTLAERNQKLRRYKQMVNSMHETACIYDAAGRFELVNKYLADWYDTTPEALEGEPSALIPRIREQADCDPYQELLDGTRDELAGELYGDFPGHGHAVLAYRLTPLRVNGTVDGIVGVARDITDRREQQAELERKDRAIDAAPGGVTISDPSQGDNPLIYVNDRFTDLTGYTEEEVLGSNCRFLQGEHTNPEPVARMREAIDDEEPVTVDLRNYRKDGTEFWNRVSIAPVHGEDGEVVNYVGFQQDVTEQKEREQEYERVVELLNHTEQIADVGGWEIDSDSRDMFWTGHLFEMVAGDYDEEPPLEKALELCVEADRPRVETAVETALRAGDPFDVEARFRRSDGDIGWSRIRGEPTVEDNTVVTVRGAVQDITEQHQRQRKLEARSAAMEASTDGIAILDADETYAFVNQAHAEIYDYDDPDTFVGNSWRMCYGESERKRFELEVMPILNAEGQWRGEAVGTRKDGSTFPQELSLSVTDNGGLICVVRDITERKAHEQQLTRQNERLEKFTSVVSHDLRNPLNMVEGRLELAKTECDSEDLIEAETALNRCQTLVDDLLTLAREGQTVAETETVSLETITERCWKTVETADATLNTDADQAIVADRSRLRQLLENLIRNAIDHAGPEVTVEVGCLEDGFYVADDGPGIPEDEREQVFESAYSTVQENTGFGLAIVSEIVDAHGWDITVTESEAGGARFEIAGVTILD